VLKLLREKIQAAGASEPALLTSKHALQGLQQRRRESRTPDGSVRQGTHSLRFGFHYCTTSACQADGLLPGLRAVLRCSVHASIGALEKSLESDERVGQLRDWWITAYGNSTGGGGCVRSVKNSKRLRAQFADQQAIALEKLDSLLIKMTGFRYAPQRFSTIIECSTLVLENVTAILALLEELRAQGGDQAAWAGRLLSQCLRPGSLLLMALIAELASVTTRYAHKFDGVKEHSKRASRIARTGFWLQSLETELSKLFSFRNSSNEPQEPLVLSEQYSCGFVQRLLRKMDLCEARSSTANGALLLYHRGAAGQRELKEWVAEEMGSISNVIKIMLQAIHSETDRGIAAALQPFDLDWWATRSDDALSETELTRSVSSIE